MVDIEFEGEYILGKRWNGKGKEYFEKFGFRRTIFEWKKMEWKIERIIIRFKKIKISRRNIRR